MPCQTVKQTGDIMKYPIVIELGDEKTACDVRIPDLDVFTAADTFEDCYAVAVEAAKIELDNMARNDRKIPTPSKVEDIVKNPEYKGFHVGLVDIDITPYLGKTERLTITLPSSLLASIDAYLQTHNIRSRSAFLADSAIEKMAR
jgi:predicted RNase H-like HicB family nuclease